jgi:4-hydroxy-tetrahydrodipicolinate synthase
VVVGVSAPGLAAIGALAGTAMDKGAAGVMVAPQGGLKSDDQILGYFANVAETLGDIPWVLQDFPLVTGVEMSASVCLKIFERHPTCVMLKHEAWPGLEKISTLRRRRGERRPPRLHPLRQRRAVPARGDDPRRRRRDDRFRLPRDDGRYGDA